MNCKQCRVEIEETDRRGRHSEAAEAHLGTCAACREFGAERRALRGLVAGLERVEAPPDFEFRLRARIAAASAERVRAGWRGLWPRAAWLTIAGCLLFAAGVALRTHHDQTADAGPASQPSTSPEVVARISDAPANAGHDGATAKQTSTAPHETNTSPREAASVDAGRAKAAQRRRVAVAAREMRAAADSNRVGAGQLESTSASLIGAPIHVSSAIPLPVQADERPLRVLFKDMQGASRVVKVDPVAFGSNDLGVQQGGRVTNASFTKTTKQGVW